MYLRGIEKLSQTIVINKPIEIYDYEALPNYFDNWYAEAKLDGIRTQLSRTDLTRDQRSKTSGFPEILPLMENIPEGTVLDGELCVLDNEYHATFERILARNNLQDKTRINLLSSKYPATFVAFDIIQFDNRDVTNLPIELRKKILATIRIPQVKVYAVDELLPKIKPFDMEGIVLKKKDSRYQSNWLKFKNYVENDFKVVGTNSKTRLISSLNLVDSKGNDVGTVNYINYPQTEEMKKKVIGMTAVVRHQWTEAGKVRFPVLKELRDPKVSGIMKYV